MTLPTFKYNPDPVSLHVIKKSRRYAPFVRKNEIMHIMVLFILLKTFLAFVLGALKMDQLLKHIMECFKTM